MALQPVPHRFTVDDYYRMSDLGFLPPDVRTELLEGEIIEMTTIGSRHAACVDRFLIEFSRSLGDQAIVRVQNPVRLDNLSEPQPDISLLRLRDDFYGPAHPGPADIFLLVEVAETTLRFDRLRKMPIYARAGISEAWLVNLKAGVVERYRNPVDGVFRQVDQFEAGQSIAPAFFPEIAFEVSAFLV